jgi:hypothetical protein
LPKLAYFTRAALALAAVLAADLLWTCAPVRAEVRSSGPIVAIGFAEKFEKDLVIPTLGWRWQLAACDTIEGWGKKIGTDFSFVIEPAAAPILGDKHSFEGQLVPFLHVEPAAMMERSWAPFVEAGIGLIYTGLDGLHLGSHVLFSDNVGLGLRFAIPEVAGWTELTIGYRFHHISHAGIFGDSNSGMNTSYLTLTLQ